MVHYFANRIYNLSENIKYGPRGSIMGLNTWDNRYQRYQRAPLDPDPILMFKFDPKQSLGNTWFNLVFKILRGDGLT